MNYQNYDGEIKNEPYASQDCLSYPFLDNHFKRK